MRPARKITLKDSELPRKGMLLQHWGGNVYVVVGFATLTSSEHDHFRMLVLYRLTEDPTDCVPLARPLSEFMEEVKDDSGQWVRRFQGATGMKL